MRFALLLLAVLAPLGACGYSSRRLSELGPARTIAVTTFQNEGYRRDLELRLTQAVIQEVRARTDYAIGSPSHADVVLSGTMRAGESVITQDADDNVIQKRLYGSLDVTLTERATGRVIKAWTVGAQSEFAPDRHGETLEGSATDDWVRRLAERVVQGFERGF
jgi:hypothetical protein